MRQKQELVGALCISEDFLAVCRIMIWHLAMQKQMRATLGSAQLGQSRAWLAFRCTSSAVCNTRAAVWRCSRQTGAFQSNDESNSWLQSGPDHICNLHPTWAELSRAQAWPRQLRKMTPLREAAENTDLFWKCWVELVKYLGSDEGNILKKRTENFVASTNPSTEPKKKQGEWWVQHSEEEKQTKKKQNTVFQKCHSRDMGQN